MTYHLILWWMNQIPYAAIFTDPEQAKTAADIRNALHIEISGRGVKVDAVKDWFRRDENGKPLPAEWRDLVGNAPVPWVRPRPPI